jgi:hypothetical protein
VSGTKGKAAVPDAPATVSDIAASLPSGKAPDGDEQTSATKALYGSSDLCVVGCKLPHGMVCQLEIKSGDAYAPSGPIVILNGGHSAKVIGGYGRTKNVPRAFMEKWLDQKKHFPPVENNLIFIENTADRMSERAKEGAEIKTGFEPLNKDAMPGVEAVPQGKEGAADEED